MAHEDARSVVDELIQTCRDGEQGFRNAAEAVEDPAAQRLFRTYADQRAQFAAELQAEASRLGGDPERSGSIAGTLHRGWMDVKSAATGGRLSSIAAEAERGEDSAKKAYEKALRASLPPDLHALVERQHAQVKQAHDQVRALRDRAA